MAPYYLHSGYFSAEAFTDQTPELMKQRWAEAKDKMVRRQMNQLKESKMPIPTLFFNKNDKILVHLPNQKPLPAIVLKDHGTTCLIDKGSSEPERFRFVCVHKSRISPNLR